MKGRMTSTLEELCLDMLAGTDKQSNGDYAEEPSDETMEYFLPSSSQGHTEHDKLARRVQFTYPHISDFLLTERSVRAEERNNHFGMVVFAPNQPQ